jgi:hypothetical protein
LRLTLGKKWVTLSEKYKKTKGVQVAEGLPSKCKAPALEKKEREKTHILALTFLSCCRSAFYGEQFCPVLASTHTPLQPLP